MGSKEKPLDQPRIAVIVDIEENRAAYKKLLEKYTNLSIEIYSSIVEFKRVAFDNPYSGMVVDFKTLFGMSASEKTFIEDSIGPLPLMKVRYNAKLKNVAGVFDEESLNGEELFEKFIKEKLPSYEPRILRREDRKNRILNLSVSFDLEKGDDSFIKRNTADISTGGCFFIDSTPNASRRDVWISIREFQNSKPIHGKVRWTLPWGKSRTHYPGYGVEFMNLTEAQLEELGPILGRGFRK